MSEVEDEDEGESSRGITSTQTREPVTFGVATRTPRSVEIWKKYLWRDNHLVSLLHLLDEAYIQLAKNPKSRRERKAKINRLNPELQASDMPPDLPDEPEIPRGIPGNWVSQAAKDKFSPMELKNQAFRPDLDLQPALNYLSPQLRRPSSSQPVAGPSRA